MVTEHACATCHQRSGGRGWLGPVHPQRPQGDQQGQARLPRSSFCSTQLKTGWFPEDEEHVVAWLNHRYYHFK
jgi:hypothetical protein